MPSYSYSIGGLPSFGGSGPSGPITGDFNLPSVESIIPRDLIGFLNNEKMRQAADAYNWQSKLLGQQQQGAQDLRGLELGEQGREYNLGDATRNREIANALTLGQGDLAFRNSGLTEQGREFDVNSAFQNTQEANRNRYLDQVLSDARAQAAFDRSRVGTQDFWDTYSRFKGAGGAADPHAGMSQFDIDNYVNGINKPRTIWAPTPTYSGVPKGR